MKRLLLIFLIVGLIACLLVGCLGTGTVVDDEDGEEGEGEEEVSRVVMVEAFTQANCANCAVVEPILEQLADEYERSEIVLVEERAYGIHSLDEIRDRFEWYLPNSDRGTPYIFFNGLNQKIYGSSTYVAIKSKINLELGKDAKIKITATRNSDSTTTTTISGTIENISTSTLDNLVINGMTFRDRGQTGLKYSVTDILEEQKETVTTLEPGDIHNFSFTITDIGWEANNFHGVIFVQDIDSSKKEILQAFYVE